MAGRRPNEIQRDNSVQPENTRPFELKSSSERGRPANLGKAVASDLSRDQSADKTATAVRASLGFLMLCCAFHTVRPAL